MNGQIKILAHQKSSLACLILFVLAANLVIGGVLLPTKIVKAQESVIDVALIAHEMGYSWWDIAWAGMKLAWEKIQAAYHAAGTWITANLGISKAIQDKIAAALKWAFTIFKKKILDMMADQIVKWIGGGGKPQFVTDWRAFLSKAANDVGGQFVSEYLGAGFLCKNISPQIQLMLAKPQTFDTAAVCTLSQIGTNIQNFYNDFTTGGWKGWITVSETQNNIYGMYFYALDRKWSAEELAAKTGSAAAQSAAGFLGDQVCLRYYKIDPSGTPQEAKYSTKDAPKKGEAPAPFTDANCTEWFTRTPGKVAVDLLSKVAGKEYDWLLQSKEYSEYIIAIADAVFNRVIKEGVALMTAPNAGATSSSFNIDYSTVTAGVADYTDAAENGPYASQLISQEKLLKENLGKIITEYQTNLDVLNQTRTVQSDAFNTLKNMAQNNCPLPGGASQQNLGTQTTGNCGANTCPCETKTVETIKVTAPSFGEATFQTTTISKYEPDPDATSYYGAIVCSQASITKTTSVTLGSLSTDADLAFTNAAISKIQTQTGLIDIAVVDLANYQKTIDDYNTAYDASQSHIGSQAVDTTVATSTIDAMYSAKQKAINSTKAIINSPTNTLANLLSEIMSASQDTATQNNDATQKRGLDMGSVGCSYGTGTGYYQTLCDIKAVKSSWDAAFDSCVAPNWSP